MKRTESFRSRLNRAINGAAKITMHVFALTEAMEIERIRAKAIAYSENHPMPRAVFPCHA